MLAEPGVGCGMRQYDCDSVSQLGSAPCRRAGPCGCWAAMSPLLSYWPPGSASATADSETVRASVGHDSRIRTRLLRRGGVQSVNRPSRRVVARVRPRHRFHGRGRPDRGSRSSFVQIPRGELVVDRSGAASVGALALVVPRLTEAGDQRWGSATWKDSSTASPVLHSRRSGLASSSLPRSSRRSSDSMSWNHPGV